MAVVAPPAPAVAAPQQLVVLDDEAVTLKNGNSMAHKQMLAVCKKALAGWEHATAADVEASPSHQDTAQASSCKIWQCIIPVFLLAVQYRECWHHKCECQADTQSRAWPGTCHVQSVWREDRADH
jgi:hypothetical protein